MDELALLKDIFQHMTGTPLGEKITTFMIAWYFVRKTIKKEFSLINGSLGTLNTSIDDLRKALTTIESGHSLRLSVLETEVKSLKTTKEVANGGSNGPSL
jgi:hypothetical protein